ncbi:MAG: 4Fe-4S dicluster domain-containing protein [Ruminococcaceae bacterium]|nr:4Fe-4S dicluster domain-containing protein [Oscillospiraceae bacterium]
MKKLAFGLMRLPLCDPNDNKSIDIEKTKEMVDEFMGHGFTYFDTAAPYHGGMSENAFRLAVAERYPRESYTVTDKLSLFAIGTKEEMPAFFDRQFEKLGVEYIDYYLVHALGRDAYAKAKDFGAFDFVRQKKAEGKICHIGFSFHDSAEMLETILTEQPDMEFVQLQINYLDWLDDGVQAKKCYEVARRYGKEVLIMEPVKGGALASLSEKSEKVLKEYDPSFSVASWAVRFCASLDGVFAVLSGMSNIEQMRDNISYMEDFTPLTEDEMRMMTDLGVAVRNDIAIPCTACRYCTDGCPQKIAIPDYFNLYNSYHRFGSVYNVHLGNRYKKIAESNGKCSDCIECGLCEEHCPQHLPIRDLLRRVAGELEK